MDRGGIHSGGFLRAGSEPHHVNAGPRWTQARPLDGPNGLPKWTNRHRVQRRSTGFPLAYGAAGPAFEFRYSNAE